MLIKILMALIFCTSALAKPTDAHLVRGQGKTIFNKTSELKAGDFVSTNEGVVQLNVNPQLQVNLGKNSMIKIVGATSVELIRGLAKVQVKKNKNVTQLVNLKDVSFSSKEGFFKVIKTQDGAELDVIQGEVMASSPLIQTFVPEIVAAKEGFRFSRLKKQFTRRKFKI